MFWDNCNWLAIKTKRRGKVFLCVFLFVFLFLLFCIKWFPLKKAAPKILNLDKIKIMCENRTVPKFHSKSIKQHLLIQTPRYYEQFAWSFRLSRCPHTSAENPGTLIPIRSIQPLLAPRPAPLLGRFARKTSEPQRQNFHTDDVKSVRTYPYSSVEYCATLLYPEYF